MANAHALARLTATKERAQRRRPDETRESVHALHMRHVALDARVESIDAFWAKRNGVVW